MAAGSCSLSAWVVPRYSHAWKHAVKLFMSDGIYNHTQVLFSV